MTAVLVRLPITLTVAGPMLTAGSTHAAWGVDTAFYRDWQDRLALPSSHVKGKLREAMSGLNDLKKAAGAPAGKWSPEDWFGRQSSDDFQPDRGRIKMTDFVLADPKDEGNGVHTRIRIDEERCTVERGALLISEQPFKPGQRIKWKGRVEFFTPEDQLRALVDQLKEAFCFITAVGAEKSIGWGRLEEVALGTPDIHRPAEASTEGPATHGLKLALIPEEPLLIGGTQNTGNIFVSQKTIPGTTIKGAYAAGLNRLAGQTRLNKAIDTNNRAVADRWPDLAAHFGSLQFLQAVPSFTAHQRNGPPPLSLGDYGTHCSDAAFTDNEEDILAQGMTAVSFRADWKNPPDHLPAQYRRPQLQYHAATRTAINPRMRKADEGQLYTLQAIKPVAGDKNDPRQLYWNTQIRLPAELDKDEATRRKVISQLCQTMDLALRYVGKRHTPITIAHETSDPPIGVALRADQRFAVVLQTPAIMLDPRTLAKGNGDIYDDAQMLLEAYRTCWADSRMLGASAGLVRHFSEIELQGGYLGMRCMKGHYSPFLLTRPGSVFVFQCNTPEAGDRLKEMERRGLPLPSWALSDKMYGSTDTWRHCPFVPENGYGEIKIATPQP